MFKHIKKYKVACSECGQEWQISAKNDESKPIYCQECYWKRRRLGELQNVPDALV
jgi:CxxC-x17-CxxC domain-containing protein